MNKEGSMAGKFPYEDIVHLPPHISDKYPQPSMMERAARFAPFAAISGYEEMVLEEARTTEKRACLDDDALVLLNEKLTMIQEFIDEAPEITITYFKPDVKKDGGSYFNVTDKVKYIDEYNRTILMSSGAVIRIEDIHNINGKIFYQLGLDE